MAGILSKGITLSYKNADTYTVIPGLMEIPDLGGTAEKVDITTLEDANYKYINGIKDFGDMSFTFLYDNSGETSNYRVVRGLEESEEVVEWQVAFPDNTTFSFSGQVSTTINGAGVNSAMTFAANISLNSDIVVATK